MRLQRFPMEIEVPRELVAVNQARATEKGYLVLSIGGRTLGPPELMTDIRESFEVLHWSAEGGGASISAKVSRGVFTFALEGGSMDAEGEGMENWSRRSKDFRKLIREEWLHMVWCGALHPLVARTVWAHLIWCSTIALIGRNHDGGHRGVERSLKALAHLTAVAVGQSELRKHRRDRQPELDLLASSHVMELSSYCEEHGLSPSLGSWVAAVRASEEGRTRPAEGIMQW